jgi:HPt (histidine-containing phosphotransfer) domain-containing protein
MNDYLSKPIEPDQLAAMLAKWLSAAAGSGKIKTRDHSAVGEIFREEELLDRLSGNQALARRLIAEFLRSAPSQLSRLAERLEVGDAPGVRKEAHALKGAAATLSAAALEDRAKHLERLAKAGDFEHGAELLTQVTDQLERLRTVLKDSGWASSNEEATGLPAYSDDGKLRR